MNAIELDIMKGLVSILNEASNAYNLGKPIMSNEQYDTRLSDLKQLEDEAGFMFVNSPTCKKDLKSIIEAREFKDDNLKECNNVEDVIEFSNQKEMVLLADITGLDMLVTYKNGFLTSIQIENINMDTYDLVKAANIPYRINKDGDYSVYGKVTLSNKPTFYVANIIKGGTNSLKDNLNEMKELGFDIILFWVANNLNPKKLQSTIDYVFDYIEEDCMPCNRIVFKFDNIKYGNISNFSGCYYSNENKVNI